MGKSRKRKSQEKRVELAAINNVQEGLTRVIDAKQKLAEYQKKISGILTQDAFQNEMARIGFGQPNILEGTSYPLTRMSYDYNLFNSMYRGSWIVRKIIDVIPSDILKNWVKLTSQIDLNAIKKFEKTIRQTGTKTKINEGLRLSRLYGGAAALIIIDGDQEELTEPLDFDKIMPDSYKGLMIFDRWSGITPSLEIIDDVNDPEFGKPKYYTVNTDDKTIAAVKVHHSRILRFEGRALPYWERQAETQWGESEIEIVFEELKKRDNTSYNIAYLIFLANVRVLKMSDMGELISSTNAEAKKSLYNVLEAQNWLMSNMGMYIMDKEDDFDTKQYSFGGLNEIYESFMLDVAGACEMPVTKLFGRAPAGFNSTGESDLKQYYETIETKQEEYLTPILDKLFPVIAMSCWGKIPDDFEWEYNPVMAIDNKELADLSGSYTGQVIEAFQAGIIKKHVALKELKQQSEITGMWTNISDNDIKEAEEEPDISGEDMGDMENEIANNMQEKENRKLNSDIQAGGETSPEVKPEPQEDTWRDKIAKRFGLN